MEKHKNNGLGVLSSKAAMDSKTLPDSTTCTFLAEGGGNTQKGTIIYHFLLSYLIFRVIFIPPTIFYHQQFSP